MHHRLHAGAIHCMCSDTVLIRDGDSVHVWDCKTSSPSENVWKQRKAVNILKLCWIMLPHKENQHQYLTDLRRLCVIVLTLASIKPLSYPNRWTHLCLQTILLQPWQQSLGQTVLSWRIVCCTHTPPGVCLFLTGLCADCELSDLMGCWEIQRNFARFETSPWKGQQELVEWEGNLTFPRVDWHRDRSALIAAIVYSCVWW